MSKQNFISRIFDHIAKWPFAIKLAYLLVIIIIPILILMIIFTPIIANRQEPAPSNIAYKFPQDFRRNDVNDVVNQMTHDHEYDFYFMWLSETNIARAIKEVYLDLDKVRTQDQHYSLLRSMKGKVEATAVLFDSIDLQGNFPDDFESQPYIKTTMGAFLYEEFKMTVAGLCYQTLYDKSFQFEWSDNAHMAAAKFRLIVTRHEAPNEKF